MPPSQRFEAQAQGGLLRRNTSQKRLLSSRAVPAPGLPARAPRHIPPASDHPVLLEELDDLLFRPAAIIAIGMSKKGAVAAVVGFQQCNVRIGQYLFAGFWKQPDEGIVRGMDHQCRL